MLWRISATSMLRRAGFHSCFRGCVRDSVAHTAAEPADLAILLAVTTAPPLEISLDRQW
jgi:hypothetical protein